MASNGTPKTFTSGSWSSIFIYLPFRYDLPLNSFQFTVIIHHVYYMRLMYSMYFWSHNFLQCLAIYYMQGPKRLRVKQVKQVKSLVQLTCVPSPTSSQPLLACHDWEMSRPSVEIGLTNFRFTEFSGSKKAIQSKENSEKKLENNYMSYTTKDQTSQRKTSLSEKKSCRMVACLDLSWSSSFSSKGIAFGFRANALRSPHPLTPCYSPTCHGNHTKRSIHI